MNSTPTISEAARRAAWKAYATAMNRMTDGLNYDSDKPPHEESIAMKEALQAALDSAHPAPKEGEKEHLLELIQQQSKTLGIVKDSECSLRSQLKTANELLGEAHGCLERAEITLRRCTAYAPNDEKTDLIMRTVKKTVDAQNKINSHLNQQSK